MGGFQFQNPEINAILGLVCLQKLVIRLHLRSFK